MIDGDPVELGAQIALGVFHQLAGEGTQIVHFFGVFRRDDEPEMMRSSAQRSAKSLSLAASVALSNIRASLPFRVTPSRLR